MVLSDRLLRTRRSRTVAATIVAVLVATVFSATPASAVAAQKPAAELAVEGASAPPLAASSTEALPSAVSEQTAPKPALAAGTYTLVLGAGWVFSLLRTTSFGGLGVHVRPPAFRQLGSTGIGFGIHPTSNATNAQKNAKVEATILSSTELAKLGLSGVAIEIKRVDASAGATQVDIRVPDSLLESLFGADYSSRVTWATVNAAKPTSKRPTAGELNRNAGNAKPASVISAGGHLIMTETVGATSSLLTTLATGNTGSGAGSFTATPASASSGWNVSTQTGSFGYAVPMAVPPAAAGPQPTVALSYDSQSVDGETGSTNNQPSTVGDGWGVSGSGFIERDYVACSADDGLSGAVAGSGDLCWSSDNATMTFAGHSGPLIRDSATGVWRLQKDDGSRVEQLHGTAQGCAANGTYNTECWRLTTTDGTQYFFGLGQLPGWVSGRPVTKSAFTVPVFGNDFGEPCHAASFAASSCLQAWRWNLDYVVDTHANAEALYYHAETNNYAVGGSVATTYTRGGSLDHIDYGLRAASLFAPNAASGRVVFGYDAVGRCADTVRSNCTAEPLDGAAVTPATPAKYPDVPFDLNCTASTCPGKVSPTFWSVAQLNTVTTQVVKSGAYVNVDKWALDHSFPNPGDGTSAVLWMTQVTHTGYTGATSIVEAATIFSGTTMQNRVWVTDGLAPLDKYRIASIRLNTGGVISVNYSAPDCAPAEASTILASIAANTRRCFPQWWTPAGSAPKLDLFHKYVVTSTVANPMTGGGADPAQETYYDYSAGVPGWRFDTSTFVPAAKRSWSVYAGYSAVTVRVGTPNSPTTQQTTAYLFYQGLDGDRASAAGGSKSVSVAGSPGVADSLLLAGMTRRVSTRLGATGAVLTSTTTTPWMSQPTASDGARTSRMVRDGNVTTDEAVSTGGVRTSTSVSTYDTNGLVLTQSRNGAAGETSTCVTNVYTPANSAAWIIGSLQQTTLTSSGCTAPATVASAVSATRFAYDGLATGVAPTSGDVTTTEAVDSFTGATLDDAHWVTTGSTLYDAFGRPTAKTDALGRVTTTAYSPAATAAAGSGALVTKSVTNPAPFSWVSTEQFDPARGQQVAATDANGTTTSTVFDALGRTTGIWLPGRPEADFPTSPSIANAYIVSMTAASSITTKDLEPSNTIASYQLFDGLGQAIQTQSLSLGGDAKISDVSYDTAGRVVQTNNPYWARATPSVTLFVPFSQSQISSSLTRTYDGAGRVLAAILSGIGNSERSRTTYVYTGIDRTSMTPPSGGTPVTTTVNSLGQTTKVVRYLAATPLDSNPHVVAAYGYNARGSMSSVQDAAGSVSTWSDDALGRTAQSTDRDTGMSQFSYDLQGNLLASTDARGRTLAYSYDDLDRKVAQREMSAAGPLLASWTYDTLAKGQLTKSSTFTGSTAEVPGLEYSSSVGGYDAAYRPTSTTVSIPVGAAAFAGTTYTEQFTYYPNGSLSLRKVPTVGGLPAESIRSTYGSSGELEGLRSAASTYLASVGYTPIGQLSQLETGGTTKSFVGFGHDQVTGSIVETNTTLQTGTTFTSPETRDYVRDAVDNITSTRVTGDDTATDTQCFTYDYLQNLSSAWTPTSNACTAAPTSSTIGGPAPYWSSYAVDPSTANRTRSIQNAVSADGVATTSDYVYSASQPHALDSVVTQIGAAPARTLTYANDAAGNTVGRPEQTLDYDAAGRLASATVGDATQQNVYDASGKLLIRSDSTAGSTLYLGDTELNRAVGSAETTAVRTYSAMGIPFAERSGSTSATTTALSWVSTDLGNTAVLRIDSATGVISRRYFDPDGNPRGPAVAWSSNHGYLNAPTSALTGLVHLGTREYDPALGRFTGVDAVGSPVEPGSVDYPYTQSEAVPRGGSLTKQWVR